ncbi:MAG: copper chaperone PCu(A)C [Gammaproteobacteria bacterium]|jgi:periplasmic copper chaperone A|nr:copper chaperone PCu(A)C [Gammaproteobacteria bacterium]MBT4462445.1 copper chaperone PCu(A)C [Gammaproteobacteria bacterium]MBT4655047.1 copper chaperone PCu(A)C [Gammaproteobacteria bacterium]MBT5116684.1 copper chaperone PCu(A)C [Gammaproteobacteria bacterium]MBT5762187.1 copper chaperone PCu(A)C [Gammaproteobacteria bacterium]
MKKNIALLLFIFLAVNTSHAFMTGVEPSKDGGAAVELISGVIHMAPPGSNVNAGYGILRNNTKNDIKLKSFRSPVFDTTEAHAMEYSDNGTARMIHLKEVVIPANGEIVFESGGLHFMFIGKRRDLSLNEEILVITRDDREVRYMLNMKVIDSRAENHHHMH